MEGVDLCLSAWFVCSISQSAYNYSSQLQSVYLAISRAGLPGGGGGSDPLNSSPRSATELYVPTAGGVKWTGKIAMYIYMYKSIIV